MGRDAEQKHIDSVQIQVLVWFVLVVLPLQTSLKSTNRCRMPPKYAAAAEISLLLLLLTVILRGYFIFVCGCLLSVLKVIKVTKKVTFDHFIQLELNCVELLLCVVPVPVILSV